MASGRASDSAPAELQGEARPEGGAAEGGPRGPLFLPSCSHPPAGEGSALRLPGAAPERVPSPATGHRRVLLVQVLTRSDDFGCCVYIIFSGFSLDGCDFPRVLVAKSVGLENKISINFFPVDV